MFIRQHIPFHLRETLCVVEHTDWDVTDDVCVHEVTAIAHDGKKFSNLRAFNCETIEIPTEIFLEINNIKELRVATEKIKESSELEDIDMAEEKKKLDPSKEKDKADDLDEKNPEFDDAGNSDDDGVEFESDAEDKPEEMDDDSDDEDLDEDGTPSLLGGGGLINILHNLIPLLNQIAEKGQELKPEDTPFDVIGDQDFNPEDPTVQQFKNEGGCKRIIRLIKIESPDDAIKSISAIVNKLKAVRTSTRIKMMRETFSAIKAAQNNINGGANQYNAALRLLTLAKDSQDQTEKNELNKAYAAVIAGRWDTLDAASFRVRNVFSSYVGQPNTRLAYTNLETQGGESYLMCPKSVYQIGTTISMETSKCRDHCIDSRVTITGKVSCAYDSWLKVADSQESAWESMDRQRHPDNEASLLTLAKGERSKPLTANEVGYEGRMELQKVHTFKDDDKCQNIEALLDSSNAPVGLGHHGEPKDGDRPAAKFAKVNRVSPDSEDTMGEQISKGLHAEGDKTWESMLEDEHKGLSDEDLDKVVELLLADSREDND